MSYHHFVNLPASLFKESTAESIGLILVYALLCRVLRQQLTKLQYDPKSKLLWCCMCTITGAVVSDQLAQTFTLRRWLNQLHQSSGRAAAKHIVASTVAAAASWMGGVLVTSAGTNGLTDSLIIQSRGVVVPISSWHLDESCALTVRVVAGVQDAMRNWFK